MFRVSISVAAMLAATVLAASIVLAAARGSTMQVVVGESEVRVPEGSTLGEVVERLELVAPPGDLLDVTGAVLRPGAYPGRILVNGRPAAPATELSSRDVIRTVAGRSRRERTSTVVVRMRRAMPANPQFTLARSLRADVEMGRISGKLDRATMRPIGPFGRPRAVALTFDDGPSRYTRGILAVLERMKARATFFVVGELAERNPRLVRRALRSGMAVENHSYSHPYRPPFDRRTREEIDREIVGGAEAIAALGRPPALFRPPGGVFSGTVVEAARARGQRVVLWSVDSEDWKRGTSATGIARRVLRDVRPGSIVLLHDGGGNRSRTVAALPAIVRGIRARGLALVLVRG